jgi:hypothetical protein
MNKWLRCLVGALLCALLAIAADRHASLAESQEGAFEKRFVSSWLGVVDGEVTTRTLTIKALHPGPADTLEADAGYGTTGSDLLPVRCTIWVDAGSTKLSLASIYGERIEADAVSDGWFIGTYTYKDGTTTSITLARIWEEDLPKNKFSLTGDAQITLVYFGAEDCAYSNRWEENDKPVFLGSKERRYVDFRIIKRKVHNRSPVMDDFPDDLKWLYEQAEAGGVSPYFVVAVDRTVVLRTYGLNNWDGKVMPLLKELCARKKIALSPRLAE